MIAPQPFWWNGDAMIPKHPTRAARAYAVGETYRLVPQDERSLKSHSHFFVSLNEAWKNLPEDFADLYPSSEHLRKRALIDCGHYDEEIIECGSANVAANVAAAIRKRDGFALIFVRDELVIVRTAKSMAMNAMKGADFQKVKSDVLDHVWALVGIDRETGELNAWKAA